MRSGTASPVAFVLLALTALCDAASAGEIFLCADKTVLYVENANRAQLYEHPCVKAWFAASAPAVPATAKTDGAAPVSATVGVAPPPVETANGKSGRLSLNVGSDAESASKPADGTRGSGATQRVRFGRRR